MGLKPLEFSDCLSDSPWYRQNLHEHEAALDDAYKNIKNIETQCRELINCTKKLAVAQKAFAKSLLEFKIETVGTNQTDDERVIGTCLKEYGKFMLQVEEERSKIINDAELLYLDPLKRFRTEALGKVINEEKRKYEKESSKFYQSLEKHLHLSTVRKTDFREADAHLDIQQHTYYKASLQYVSEIQCVQERMKFEFVETLSSFLYAWLTFYHVGHVIHEDFKPYLDGVQQRVQRTKESYKATIAEAEGLKEKILKTFTKQSSGSGAKLEGSVPNIKQGYMYMQEKSKIPKTIGRDVLGKWTKYYCVFSRETRIFTMIPVNSTEKKDMRGALGQSVAFKLKECIRRPADSIDKRFCLDVLADEKTEAFTFQALSEDDRRQWLDALDGKQTVYSPGSGPSCSGGFPTQLDDTGFEFVQSCISALEERGIHEQGLYRNCGVTSKVQKLLQLGLDKRKTTGADKLNVMDEQEWEIKTISSAVKTFLRNLPEPLMTFDQHSLFINAAKMDDRSTRVNHIHYYVHQMPPIHMKMLQIIIKHLRRVADRCEENLMTVGNLGVCFGPTLLRPKEETMAAIMDIKFSNVVVEVLIANCDQIFDTEPPRSVGQPCPPKPDHRSIKEEHSQPINSPNRSTDNGRPTAGQSLSAGSSAIKHRPIVTASPAIRARSPRTLAPVNTATATAHIYETVPPEGVVSRRLVAAGPTVYGQPSTSGATTPTTPPHVTNRAGTSGSVQQSALRNNDSSDSLNSLLSHRSDSPKGVAGIVKATEAAKAKVSTSYAPPYNPMACEAIESKLKKRNSEANLLCSTADFSVMRVHAVPVAGGYQIGAAALQNNDHPQTNVIRNAVQPMYSSFVNPVVSLQPSRRVKTLYACTPDHESELCFQPGQIITNVYESKEDGWLVGTLNGKTGLIPSNYVEPLS